MNTNAIGKRFLEQVRWNDEPIPVLHPEDAMLRAEELRSEGVQKILLCVDEDSEAIRALSPRFVSDQERHEKCEQIAERIQTLASHFEVWVGLTVEELCPGGLDPSDGIALAQGFEKAGAKAIVASSGTRDFMPLKNRRETQQKNSPDALKAAQWPEPWLSTALWLVGRVQVPVYAQGPVAKPAMSLAFAKAHGLAGVIDSSAICPSSS